MHRPASRWRRKGAGAVVAAKRGLDSEPKSRQVEAEVAKAAKPATLIPNCSPAMMPFETYRTSDRFLGNGNIDSFEGWVIATIW